LAAVVLKNKLSADVAPLIETVILSMSLPLLELPSVDNVPFGNNRTFVCSVKEAVALFPVVVESKSAVMVISNAPFTQPVQTLAYEARPTASLNETMEY